ncbi:MAG: hypothetical protein V4596_06750 [Bdellovibrionota bacterium]
MIYLIFLLNSVFAQFTGCIGMGGYTTCSPTIVYEKNNNGDGKFGGESYAAEKSAMERMVEDQERQRQEFTQKYIDRETVKMDAAQTQIKRNLVSMVSRNSANYASKTKDVDQFRMYIDSAESLKFKFDKYNQNIDSNSRNYKAAVDNAEGIIYSNISSSFPKGFNSEGIFIPESIDSSVPKSPLVDFKSNHALTSQQGQIVRRMVNQYQASWGENSFFLRRSYSETSQYLLGASYVRLADEKFNSNPMQALAYLHMAKSILDFSEGVITGAKDNIKNIIKMAPELANALKDYSNAVVNDPTHLVSSIYDLAMATPRLAAALTDHLKSQMEILEKGSAYERGEVVGEYILDVLGAFSSLGSSTIVSGVRVGTVTVAKTAMKEFAEELATNPVVQKLISKELIPAVREAVEITNTLKNASRPDALKALEMNHALKSTGKVKVTSEAVEYTQVVATPKGNIEWNHNVLIKDLNNVHVKTAEEVNHLSKIAFETNPANVGKQYQPSVKPNTKVFEYTTHVPTNDKFARVYSDELNLLGSWILDKNSIKGLTPEQIQDKFALPRLPVYIVDVDVPAGAVLRKSVPNAIFGSSGKQVATQFEIAVEKLPTGSNLESMFKNPRKLP